jgi:hypothetical protein
VDILVVCGVPFRRKKLGENANHALPHIVLGNFSLAARATMPKYKIGLDVSQQGKLVGKRIYIYRSGETQHCALTGAKDDPPASRSFA